MLPKFIAVTYKSEVIRPWCVAKLHNTWKIIYHHNGIGLNIIRHQ